MQSKEVYACCPYFGHAVNWKMKIKIQRHSLPWVNFLFVFILYVPSTIFHLSRDASSCVEPLLS